MPQMKREAIADQEEIETETETTDTDLSAEPLHAMKMTTEIGESVEPQTEAAEDTTSTERKEEGLPGAQEAITGIEV